MILQVVKQNRTTIWDPITISDRKHHWWKVEEKWRYIQNSLKSSLCMFSVWTSLSFYRISNLWLTRGIYIYLIYITLGKIITWTHNFPYSHNHSILIGFGFWVLIHQVWNIYFPTFYIKNGLLNIYNKHKIHTMHYYLGIRKSEFSNDFCIIR